MVNIDTLLNKTNPTGEDLGILDLAYISHNLKQVSEGRSNPEPLFPISEFNDKLQAFYRTATREELAAYQRYIEIHEWLVGFAGSVEIKFQQAQVCFRTLSGKATAALMAEAAIRYIQTLPVVMTRSEYERTLQAGKRSLVGGDGQEPEMETLLSLVDRWVSYQLKQMRLQPRKKNPLKKIRELYAEMPVQSKEILDAYPLDIQHGYYEAPGGERSDQMTAKAWAKLEARLMENRTFDQIRFVTYTEAPEGMTKWDLISEDVILRLFPLPVVGAPEEERWTPGNVARSVEILKAEFPELVDLALDDIQKTVLNADYNLEIWAYSDLKTWPAEAWDDAILPTSELIRCNTFGARDDEEAELVSMGASLGLRAIYGVAQLGDQYAEPQFALVDKAGDYRMPDIPEVIQVHILNAMIDDNPSATQQREILESANTEFASCYYFLQGYNKIVELIADFCDLPEILAFQRNLSALQEQMNTVNTVTGLLYAEVTQHRDFLDPDKDKKLDVIRRYFPVLDYKQLVTPKEKVRAAESLIKSWQAFSPAGRINLEKLVCQMPGT